MTALEIIQKRYENGFPILQHIFNLPAAEVRKTLHKLVERHTPDLPRDFILNGRVGKESVDDEPRSVFVSSYDFYLIDYQGIHYCKEHHSPSLVIPFTEGFKV